MFLQLKLLFEIYVKVKIEPEHLYDFFSPQIEVDSVVLYVSQAWADVWVGGRVGQQMFVQP